jgi:hypothetical protein
MYRLASPKPNNVVMVSLAQGLKHFLLLNKSGHSEAIESTKKRYTSGDPILSPALKKSLWFPITAPG